MVTPDSTLIQSCGVSDYHGPGMEHILVSFILYKCKNKSKNNLRARTELDNLFHSGGLTGTVKAARQRKVHHKFYIYVMFHEIIIIIIRPNIIYLLKGRSEEP